MYGPTKVRNLQLSLEPQEQILWLYVSVNHLLLVAVRQSICQFLHDLGRPMTGGQTRADLQLPAASPEPRAHCGRPRCPPLPNRGCSLLVKSAALLQLLVELPAGGILQNQVDPSTVIEIVVETQDVGMPGRRDIEASGHIRA